MFEKEYPSVDIAFTTLQTEFVDSGATANMVKDNSIMSIDGCSNRSIVTGGSASVRTLIQGKFMVIVSGGSRTVKPIVSYMCQMSLSPWLLFSIGVTMFKLCCSPKWNARLRGITQSLLSESVPEEPLLSRKQNTLVIMLWPYQRNKMTWCMYDVQDFHMLTVMPSSGQPKRVLFGSWIQPTPRYCLTLLSAFKIQWRILHGRCILLCPLFWCGGPYDVTEMNSLLFGGPRYFFLVIDGPSAYVKAFHMRAKGRTPSFWTATIGGLNSWGNI